MKMYRQTEELIRLRLGNAKFEKAYSDLFTYFSFVDYRDNTNHCSILNLVYNLPKRKLPFKKIAFLSNVSDSTLLRYRKMYAYCFNYYLNNPIDATGEIAPSGLDGRQHK